MRSRRWFSYAFLPLAVLLVALAAACGGSDSSAPAPAEPAPAEPAPAEPAPAEPAPAEPAPSEPAPAEPAPAEPAEPAPAEPAEGGQTLIVAAAATPATIDPDFIAGVPQGWEIGNNLYDEKIYYKTDKAGGTRSYSEFEPRLFESWETSDDGLTWTWHLRQGVKSCAGNEFTADDVKWSFDRSFGLQGLTFFLAIQINLTKPENVVVVDPYTVQFKLDAPSPLVQHQMTLGYHAMFDSKVIKEHVTDDDPWAKNWLGNNGAGFGAYCLKEFTAGQQVVLEANPNYYGGVPNVTKVIYKAVPDPANRASLLANGDVDIAEGLSPEQLTAAKSQEGVGVAEDEGNTLIAAVLQSKNPALADPLVRQALNYATPSEQVLADAFAGFGSAAGSILPPRYETYTNEFWPYTYDEAKAKDLLAQSGVALPLKLKVTYSPFDPTFERLATILKSAWGKVGIELTLESVTNAKFAEVTANKSFDILLPPALSSHNADPIYTMEIFAGGARACCNWANWEDADAFAALDKAAVELDPAARAQDSLDVQKAAGANPPWVVMGVRKWTMAHRANVTGFIWNPQESLWFHELTKA